MLITSLTNAKVKQWHKYQQKKYRNQDQRFLIEGLHLIEEAHKANLIEAIIVDENFSNPYQQYPIYTVTSNIMDKLSMHQSTEKIMAVCKMKKQDDRSLSSKIIILDNLQDPGNIGTIIRSAYSFGYETIILSNDSTDLYNDKLIRSTQGAIFHLNILQVPLLPMMQNLKELGYKIYATSLKQAQPLSTIVPSYPLALVFGNEGNGVSQAVLANSDQNIIIEMNNFESLNVAVAAGICMYQFK
ncbi:MAG: RNA methyltransferase [Erysipelotrichaceae bacterium]|nr:RNA methyltransferase [Erysipelotrichaceae bacterium]MDY5252600.1 RNA methyltransferase [Erysipelotrichaceae bacterium]